MFSGAILEYVYDQRCLYQILGSLATFLLIKSVCFMRARRTRYHLFKHHGIPGPEPTLLQFGNLGMYRPEEAKFKVDERLTKEYGKVFGIYIGDEPSIFVSDLDILSKVFFEESGKTFKERSVTFLETSLSDGILFAKHNRWRAMRKILSPYFSSYKVRGDSATQFIEHSVKLMIDYIDQQLDEAQAANRKANINMHNLMKSTALHLISDMAIKLPDVEVSENARYVKNLDEYLSTADKGMVILAIMFPPFKRLLQFLYDHVEHETVLSVIHRRINQVVDKHDPHSKEDQNNNNGGEQMMIDTLVQLYHEGKLTRKEVIGNVDAILMAGYDTTSTTLTYVLWVLAKYPEIQEQLRTELMAHGVESKYLEQVINETMRLYPTVMTFATRLATQTVKVNGWTIPQGARVLYNAWVLHRDPDNWPNPEKFDPDRFRSGANIHPCAFAPFGLGDRKCLGYHLAMLEMKMVVCDILLRYRLKLISPENLELVSCAIVLTKPKEEVMIELERIPK